MQAMPSTQLRKLESSDNSHALSRIAAINHATDTLGLYRAELAHVLGFRCQDASESARLESIFENSLVTRDRADRFLASFWVPAPFWP